MTSHLQTSTLYDRDYYEWIDVTLLKYQYQPEKRSSSWVSTILEQRRQINSLLEDSPSLKHYYLEIFAKCYSDAVLDASAETRLPVNAFPIDSLFAPQDVIDSVYVRSMFEA